MSFINRLLGKDGVSQLDVDSVYFAAGVRLRPLLATAGHYRVNHRCAINPNQAANSRLFEVRNPDASKLIIPTRLVIKWLQTAAHTAAIEDSLDVFKCTGFSVIDPTNAVALVPSLKRGTMSASIAQVRGNTIAGAAAGMNGGTLTKDTSSVGQLPQWLLLAQPTASTIVTLVIDNFDDVNGTHPFVFAQNEGFIVENRVLLGAAAGSTAYFDFSWAESTSF